MNRHRSLKFISRAWITALYTILVFYLFRIIAVSLCLVIVEPCFFCALEDGIRKRFVGRSLSFASRFLCPWRIVSIFADNEGNGFHECLIFLSSFCLLSTHLACSTHTRLDHFLCQS